MSSANSERIHSFLPTFPHTTHDSYHWHNFLWHIQCRLAVFRSKTLNICSTSDERNNMLTRYYLLLSSMYYRLIPLYGIAISASFIIFQCIGKCTCVTTECKVITCIRSKNDRTAHVKAMKVTL